MVMAGWVARAALERSAQWEAAAGPVAVAAGCGVAAVLVVSVVPEASVVGLAASAVTGAPAVLVVRRGRCSLGLAGWVGPAESVAKAKLESTVPSRVVPVAAVALLAMAVSVVSAVPAARCCSEPVELAALAVPAGSAAVGVPAVTLWGLG